MWLRPCSAILRGAERAEQRLINSADYNWIAAPLRRGAAERRESERGLSNGIGADKISIVRYLPESTIRTIENVSARSILLISLSLRQKFDEI